AALGQRAILPTEYSAAVYTGTSNDPAHMKKGHLDEKEEQRIPKELWQPRRAAENSYCQRASAPKRIDRIRSVGDQSAISDVVTEGIDRRQPVRRCLPDDQLAVNRLRR